VVVEPLQAAGSILRFRTLRSFDSEASNRSIRRPPIVRLNGTKLTWVPVDYIKRRVTEVVRERMAEVPVIALQGPRSVGKSTVLGEIAREHGATIINLDLPDVRDAVRSDPYRAIRQPGTIFIDEYQRFPEILDIIKAEVDAEFRPGKFVLTGSTRFDALPRSTQTLTGRISFVSIWPFSQGELDATRETFLDVAITDPARLPVGFTDGSTYVDYAERMCAGGMPVAIRAGRGRNRWFDDYATSALERDAAAISNLRRGAELPILFARLAGQTAQPLNITSAAREIDLEVSTTSSYLKLLEDLFLIYRLPAWGRTLRSRAAKLPKVHVGDSGLAARLMRVTPERLSRNDPAALTEFGHLLETFVVGELLKQVSWSDNATAVGHWRTHDGQEVDLIVERDDGAVIGFEVKAARKVDRKTVGGLTTLRQSLGDQFRAGYVLTTGDASYRYDDRIYVMPVDRLWKTIGP
jgi:predicted AAA+ superfamily ATPase